MGGSPGGLVDHPCPQTVQMSVWMSVRMSVQMSVWMSVQMSVWMSVWMFVARCTLNEVSFTDPCISLQSHNHTISVNQIPKKNYFKSVYFQLD